MAYSMSDLLQLVVSEGASDLHLRVGIPPTIRVHGILHRVEGPPLSPEDAEELMRSITSEENIQHVRERGGADYGFAFGEAARFRVKAAWTCRVSRKVCGARCAKTRISCWSVKCATWKPSKPPSRPPKRVTWCSAPCTRPVRPKPSIVSRTPFRRTSRK